MPAERPSHFRARRVEFGDWQTPPALARQVMELVARLEPRAVSVLEPTCGEGAFLVAARHALPDARLAGYEISRAYVERARAALAESAATVRQADFFATPWEDVMAELPEPIAVVGNPPWVTSSTLGVLEGKNLPPKSNFKRASGYDALTGKSNFDISEWMIGRLLHAALGRRFTLALICKASVARKLMWRAHAEGWPVTGSVWRVDAREHFRASVAAVVLVVCGEPLAVSSSVRPTRWDVYASLDASVPERSMGVADAQLTSDLDAHASTSMLAGDDGLDWRSGVKHDLARVMELVRDGAAFRNGLGERVELEPTHVHPLLKGSDIANDEPRSDRFVIVTQSRLDEDTTELATRAPLTHRYLERHRAAFEARKSRIYRNRPPFAMFGVGAYSFAPYKVAISGLHKRLAFRVIGPREGRPVMLDDTSYFLPCSERARAERLAKLLATPLARDFFEARVFWDEMRPINKALLGSLSFAALERELAGRDDEIARPPAARRRASGRRR